MNEPVKNGVPSPEISIDQKVDKIVKIAMDEIDYLAQIKEIPPLTSEDKSALEKNYRLNVRHALTEIVSDQIKSDKYLSICADVTALVKDEDGRYGGVRIRIGGDRSVRDIVVAEPDNQTAARLDTNAATSVLVRPFDCLR